MFDRNKVRQLSADINAALLAVAQKHGVSLKTGAIRFNPENATIKVEAVAPNGGAEAANEFKKRGFLYGLFVEDLGRTFVNEGVTYTVYGLKPSAHKFPVLIKRVKDGKIFKTTPGRLNRYLGHHDQNREAGVVIRL